MGSAASVGWAVSAALQVVHRNRKANALLLQYADAKGELQEAFRNMKVSQEMRLSWLQRWQTMDKDGSKLLDYAEFLEACGLRDNMWSSRMFDLLDKHFVGCLDFLTFFTSLPRLLVFDRANAMEVTFRMCSRRGATWDPEQSVLDEKDIRLFVQERYPALDRKHTLHRAIGILAHLDDDCSGGVSFQEFKIFCGRNPVFMAAVEETLQSIRNSIFGVEFWQDFTKTARTFNRPTRNEIFCASQTGLDGDEDSGGFAVAARRRVATAAKLQFHTVASAASNKKGEYMSVVSSSANTTGQKLRRAASEAVLGRRLAPEEKEPLSDENAGKVAVERPKLWSASPLSGAADKGRSLSARARVAGAKLRRVMSDSDLRSLRLSENSAKDQGVTSLSPTDTSTLVRSSGKLATERLARNALDLLHSSNLVRQRSTRKVEETRDRLTGEAHKLTESAKDAAGRIGKIGRLKATAVAFVVIRRMRTLAEAGRQNREHTARRAATLQNTSLKGLALTLPHQLPDGEMGKWVGEASKAGGGRALAALRRSVRLISTVRTFDQKGVDKTETKGGAVEVDGEPADHQDEQGEERLPDHSNWDDEALELSDVGGEEAEKVAAVETPWEVLTGAKVKAEVLASLDRQWAATEKFYAYLATATERLEAKRSNEKGYDFSADFPKVWCALHAHGSHGERVAKYRLKRRTSASKRAAKVYLRFIELWQRAGGKGGRSKLGAAFNRWRLNTCDAAMDDLRESFLSQSGGSTAVTASADDLVSTTDGTHAPRCIQSIQEMWESRSVGVSDEDRMYSIIMNSERAERLLPWELCEMYEREMVKRIDRRQAENNVPILPNRRC